MKYITPLVFFLTASFAFAGIAGFFGTKHSIGKITVKPSGTR